MWVGAEYRFGFGMPCRSMGGPCPPRAWEDVARAGTDVKVSEGASWSPANCCMCSLGYQQGTVRAALSYSHGTVRLNCRLSIRVAVSAEEGRWG